MPFLVLAFSLLGISLGSPALDLRARLGDPLVVETGSSVSRTADYLRSDDISGVVRITEREGVVFAIEIERERPESSPGPADTHGVSLGMSRAAVAAKRGTPAFTTVNTVLYPEDPNEDASTIYRFDDDVLESIKLAGSGSSAPGNPALPHLAEAAGDGFATAILDISNDVFESDHFRDRYLTVHGCDAGGRTSTVERRDGKTYAFGAAVCNGKKRTFYFDISRARP
jgi:hypothetical protein